MKSNKLLVSLATLLLTAGATVSVFGSINRVKADSTVQQQGTPLVKNSQIGQGFYSPQQKLAIPNPILRTDPTTFFNSIKQGAVDTWGKHNFLPSVTAAQAAIESGWGTSGLTATANNLFGIKGRYNGQYVVYPTQEWINGHYVTVNAEFRKYPNWAASVEDHGNFFTDNPRYHNLLGLKDYKQVANLLQQDGYATDPNYAATIIRVIEQYGLQSWDTEGFNNGFPMNPIDESVATVTYEPGYGILAFHLNGESIPGSNYTFLTGTQWKVNSIATINGEEMLNVGNDTYIPRRYTNIDNRELIVNYVPGYGVLTYHADGTPTGNYLPTGGRYKNNGESIINGMIMYLVGNNEYLPKQYTQFGPGK